MFQARALHQGQMLGEIEVKSLDAHEGILLETSVPCSLVLCRLRLGTAYLALHFCMSSLLE